MKKIKKIMALVIAVIMCMTMISAVAFAENDTITISVNTPAQSDQNGTPETYTAYKIFSVVKSTDASGNNSNASLGSGSETGYNYTISESDPFYTKIVTDGILNEYITLTGMVGSTTKTVTIKSGKNNENAAKEMAAILQNNLEGISGTSLTATSGNGPVSADVVPGYYMIISSLGSNLILATTDIDITEKNSYPTISKSASTTNLNIGDEVTYTIEVVVPDSVDEAKDIVVTDTLDNVLKYTAGNATASVKNISPAQNVTLTESAITKGESTNSWTWTFSANGLAGKTVVITYTAKLLDTAAADTNYVNKAFLEYSNYKTPEVNVTVKTFDFDLEKTDGTSVISGAEFELRTGSSTGKAIKFTSSANNYTKVDGEVDSEGDAKITAGTVNIKGLAAGTYYLVETKAPDGYNKLEKPIIVTIDTDGNASIAADDANNSDDNGSIALNKVTVVNNKGTVLPSTGGIGTTIFYIVGACLVIGAGILLVTRRRMKAE